MRNIFYKVFCVYFLLFSCIPAVNFHAHGSNSDDMFVRTSPGQVSIDINQLRQRNVSSPLPTAISRNDLLKQGQDTRARAMLKAKKCNIPDDFDRDAYAQKVSNPPTKAADYVNIPKVIAYILGAIVIVVGAIASALDNDDYSGVIKGLTITMTVCTALAGQLKAYDDTQTQQKSIKRKKKATERKLAAADLIEANRQQDIAHERVLNIKVQKYQQILFDLEREKNLEIQRTHDKKEVFKVQYKAIAGDHAVLLSVFEQACDLANQHKDDKHPLALALIAAQKKVGDIDRMKESFASVLTSAEKDGSLTARTKRDVLSSFGATSTRDLKRKGKITITTRGNEKKERKKDKDEDSL